MCWATSGGLSLTSAFSGKDWSVEADKDGVARIAKVGADRTAPAIAAEIYDVGSVELIVKALGTDRPEAATVEAEGFGTADIGAVVLNTDCSVDAGIDASGVLVGRDNAVEREELL